ncbi:ribonuclease H-like domain-containing protein [Tanacetum coccineum]
MIGNKSHLSDYEEIDSGFVAFGGDPKGDRITSKGKISTGKLDFKDVYLVKELKVPRKDNMYNVDSKNIVPSGGLTCFFAKAILDESNLWHKRLGHINFKTLNKLVRRNLVRGLPSKIFENNHTCVACQKGKQHKASCIENLIDLKVKVIRCDNGTEFKNKVMNQFCEMKGRKHALSFMRPFGCPVTILNTLDHLGKFDGKAEGFFVGYSTNRNGPNLLFDIYALTISMNYKPVIAGNQTNGNAGTKENIDAGQDRKKMVPDQKYILLPLLTSDPLLSKCSKDSPNARFKESGEEEKMDSEHPKNEDSEVPNIEEPRINQEQDANVNNTNNINTVCPSVIAADIENNVADKNIVYGCIDDPNMPNLEEIVYFDNDEEVGAEANMNNLATTVPVSPTPTIRVHKDHPLEKIIRYIQSAPQTKRMTNSVTEHEPKKVTQALTDPSWIEEMQDELL